MDWKSLIVPITKKEIREAIKDNQWQDIRLGLLGTSLEHKYKVLTAWKSKGDRKSVVQVANYVNALKRGGLI